jgi:hypothetical protein
MMTGTARDKIAFFACCFIKGDLPGAGGRGMDGSDVGLERCELAPSRILIIICQDRLGTNTNEKNNSVKNIAGAFVPQAAAMARPALAAMRSVQVA